MQKMYNLKIKKHKYKIWEKNKNYLFMISMNG